MRLFKMGVQLTQSDMQDLKIMGFRDDEIREAVSELEQEELTGSYNNAMQKSMQDPRQFSRQSAFAFKPEDNMVKWQLELNDILEKAEHILRGDKPTFKDGHNIWDDNPTPQKNPLNENGVQELMRIMAMHINRDTILSDYEAEEIRFKVLDIGRRINNLVFAKYDEFGLDTEEKRKNYEVIVGDIVDLIHSTYNRAKDGNENRSLRTARQITQTESMNPNGMMMQGGMMQQPSMRERGFLNPFRYIKGKFKE